MNMEVIIQKKVYFIEFDKKDRAINASPYLMWLLWRTKEEIEKILQSRHWEYSIRSAKT